MKLFLIRIKRFFLISIISFFILSIGLVILYRFLPIPLTPLMIQRYFSKDIPRFKKDWVSINAINPEMALAVISSEDQLFLEHYGFDIKAIKKAVAYNQKKKGKKVKGASTISQQTAKNVFLWQGRTWVRKGLEVYFTTLIELLWSKERIIEVYLNVIEMGKGVYGIEAAANFYFNKTAKQINASECASIAAILPNPIKWDAKNRNTYTEKRRVWILNQMRHLREGITDKLFEEEEPEE